MVDQLALLDVTAGAAKNKKQTC